MSHINSEMAAAVGTETGRQDSFPISASDIRRWAIAVYWPEPPPRLFWDEEYASGTRHGGIVAPEEFNPFAWMSAHRSEPPRPTTDEDTEPNDPNRFEKSLGIQSPGLRFQLNGGMECDYGARMRPGDVITAVGRLAGYHEREGRLGLMLFTVSESTWTNQRDELVKRTRSTLIRY
jgi:N-terminal half of MaoC dehydratase